MPPRKVADTPGTAVSAAPSAPPVSDSATATVSPRDSSPACTSAASEAIARSSGDGIRSLPLGAPGPLQLGSGRSAPQTQGPLDVVGAGDHGDHHGGVHDE